MWSTCSPTTPTAEYARVGVYVGKESIRGAAVCHRLRQARTAAAAAARAYAVATGDYAVARWPHGDRRAGARSCCWASTRNTRAGRSVPTRTNTARKTARWKISQPALVRDLHGALPGRVEGADGGRPMWRTARLPPPDRPVERSATNPGRGEPAAVRLLRIRCARLRPPRLLAHRRASRARRRATARETAAAGHAAGGRAGDRDPAAHLRLLRRQEPVDRDSAAVRRGWHAGDRRSRRVRRAASACSSTWNGWAFPCTAAYTTTRRCSRSSTCRRMAHRPRAAGAR